MVILHTHRLSRDDKMFERNVQSALTASLKSAPELLVIGNPSAVLNDTEDAWDDSKGMEYLHVCILVCTTDSCREQH